MTNRQELTLLREKLSESIKAVKGVCSIVLKLEKENAELLEQRKELLEALKEMLRWTDGNCAEDPTTESLSIAEKNALDAIKKADKPVQWFPTIAK